MAETETGANSRREQRGVVIPMGGGLSVLEGLFVAGAGASSGGAVVAPPHPEFGGSMDSPVVNELAWSCQRAGLASLCFNWRGVGASSGRLSGDPGEAAEDYSAALEHLTESVEGAVVACGYSWGAATAVRAALGAERVARALLVAPPAGMLDAEVLRGFGGEVLVIVGEADQFAPPGELGPLVASLDRAEFVTVPGADHFFGAGLGAISRAAGEWFARTG